LAPILLRGFGISRGRIRSERPANPTSENSVRAKFRELRQREVRASARNPHSLVPIGQDHRRGDAHILGYYVLCSSSEISEPELGVSSEELGQNTGNLAADGGGGSVQPLGRGLRKL
jgi:hypothetical protein